jgi:hypothetical protein
MSWPNKVYSKSIVPKYTKYNDTNMLFRYSGVKRDGKYLDASGNGNNSTATLIVSSGDDNISFTNGTSYVRAGTLVNPATQPHTMSALVKGSVIAGATYGVILGAFAGATITAYGGVLLVGSTVYLVWFNGGVTRSVGSPINTNLKNHYSYVVDFVNNAGYLYVNSVLSGTLPVVDIINPGTLNHGLGAVCYSAPAVASLEGNIKDGTLWNRALSSVDLRKEWLQYAAMVQLKTGWGSKVSIANESTAGNFVGNGSTPFEILSGTWNLNVSTQFGESTKTIECIAAGTLWLDNKFMGVNTAEGSYGSWRIRMTHVNGTNSYIGLCCSSKSAFSTHNGYAVKFDTVGTKSIIRHAAAVETFILGIPAGQLFQVTRRFDNVWNGFARLDSFPQLWNNVGFTGTDATYTTSQGMCFTLNAGDRLSLGSVDDNNSLVKYLGEFSPEEV